MYKSVKNALNAVGIILDVVVRPRRFIQRHTIGEGPATRPLYALIYCLGGVAILTGLFSLLAGQYLPEYTDTRSREPERTSSLPNEYPVLYELQGTELIGAMWTPGYFAVGIMASGETDEATGRIPVVLFTFGSFRATFANYPSGVFTTKGGQALLATLYCAMSVLCIYPFMKFFGGSASLANTFKMLLVIISYFILLATLLFTAGSVIFIYARSAAPNIVIPFWTIATTFSVIVLRAVILSLSELHRISSGKVIVGGIFGGVFSMIVAPIVLIPGAFAIAVVHRGFDIFFG